MWVVIQHVRDVAIIAGVACLIYMAVSTWLDERKYSGYTYRRKD